MSTTSPTKIRSNRTDGTGTDQGASERIIKTGEVKEQSEIFEEFDITMSVIDSLLIRTQDSEGKIHISWGSQRITE